MSLRCVGPATAPAAAARRAGAVALVAALASMLPGCAAGPMGPAATSGVAAPQSAGPTLASPSQIPDATPSSTAPTPVQSETPPRPTDTPTTSSGPPAHFSAQPVSVGRLLLTTLAGAASGVTMRVWVWLPPQYDDPAYAHKVFPVLTLYPGGDGVNYTQFFDAQKVGIVAEGAAAGRLSPFILVEPQLQPSVSLDTECTDLAGLPKVGTFMEQDVPAMLRASFRVAPTRSGWGVGGVSSGAYCASKLLFARPDVWSAGASLGGYFVIDTSLPAGRTSAALATSPQAVAESRPPVVVLRAWVGNSDRHALQQNRDFFKVLRSPTQADLKVVDGNHTWVTFQQLLPEMFSFFTEHLDRP